MKRILAAIALTVVASYAVVGYAPQSAEGLSSEPKTTPAYGVLVLHKVAVEAELADLSAAFTSQHPDLQRKRFELRAISREMERMLAIEKSSVPKLSSTYGNLVLRKVALEVELEDMLGSFTLQHPDIKRKRVELAALKREIEKILR
jgi:uncharacterized protein involved in exopolysaccharide biosynthesis